MKLRTKALMAVIALAAASTVTIGSLAYAATDSQLNSEIDSSLRDVAAYAASATQGDNDHGGGRSGQAEVKLETVLVQTLDSSGAILSAPSGIAVPVDASDRAIATGSIDRARYRDVAVDGRAYRMLTTAGEHNTGAVQVLRPLSERNGVLAALRWKIVLAAIAVLAAATATGWFLVRRITRRLTRLAVAAGTVAETGRLDLAVPDPGTDEVAQVATAFSRMLAVLHRSEEAQRRLVQDAGHELRTPLTSLQTNLEVLARYPDLAVSERATVIADLHSETRELTSLVNELVDITSGDLPAPPSVRLRLADVAREVVQRASRRTGRVIELSADETTIQGQRTQLERAISNLVDNALKFSPAPAPVEVTVRDGRVAVRDHGSGVAPQDRERIFDRFYRADAARALPGSGLGLAIVRSVASGHGGEVFVESHPGGGAVIGFTLRQVPRDESTSAPSGDPG